MAIIENRPSQWLIKMINFLQVAFLLSLLKTYGTNLNSLFSKYSAKTIVDVFQWIPSLLINPASFLLITISGSVSYLLPFCKRAWQMIQLG
jgi:hypothetical protein